MGLRTVQLLLAEQLRNLTQAFDSTVFGETVHSDGLPASLASCRLRITSHGFE